MESLENASCRDILRIRNCRLLFFASAAVFVYGVLFSEHALAMLCGFSSHYVARCENGVCLEGFKVEPADTVCPSFGGPNRIYSRPKIVEVQNEKIQDVFVSYIELKQDMAAAIKSQLASGVDGGFFREDDIPEVMTIETGIYQITAIARCMESIEKGEGGCVGDRLKKISDTSSLQALVEQRQYWEEQYRLKTREMLLRFSPVFVVLTLMIGSWAVAVMVNMKTTTKRRILALSAMLQLFFLLGSVILSPRYMYHSSSGLAFSAIMMGFIFTIVFAIKVHR